MVGELKVEVAFSDDWTSRLHLEVDPLITAVATEVATLRPFPKVHRKRTEARVVQIDLNRGWVASPFCSWAALRPGKRRPAAKHYGERTRWGLNCLHRGQLNQSALVGGTWNVASTSNILAHRQALRPQGGCDRGAREPVALPATFQLAASHLQTWGSATILTARQMPPTITSPGNPITWTMGLA